MISCRLLSAAQQGNDLEESRHDAKKRENPKECSRRLERFHSMPSSNSSAKKNMLLWFSDILVQSIGHILFMLEICRDNHF